MKLLLDMNLPPRWAQFFAAEGIECVHWSAVGESTAEDSLIMAYAQENGFIVFTHADDGGCC